MGWDAGLCAPQPVLIVSCSQTNYEKYVSVVNISSSMQKFYGFHKFSIKSFLLIFRPIAFLYLVNTKPQKVLYICSDAPIRDFAD